MTFCLIKNTGLCPNARKSIEDWQFAKGLKADDAWLTKDQNIFDSQWTGSSDVSHLLIASRCRGLAGFFWRRGEDVKSSEEIILNPHQSLLKVSMLTALLAPSVSTSASRDLPDYRPHSSASRSHPLLSGFSTFPGAPVPQRLQSSRQDVFQ